MNQYKKKIMQVIFLSILTVSNIIIFLAIGIKQIIYNNLSNYLLCVMVILLILILYLLIFYLDTFSLALLKIKEILERK